MSVDPSSGISPSTRGFQKLSVELRILVQKIADLFDQFQGAKTYGGDGWEALFGLVLLRRRMKS